MTCDSSGSTAGRGEKALRAHRKTSVSPQYSSTCARASGATQAAACEAGDSGDAVMPAAGARLAAERHWARHTAELIWRQKVLASLFGRLRAFLLRGDNDRDARI